LRPQGRWLPDLTEKVRTINSHFSRMLRQMGCNGEVALHCGCEQYDGCNAFDKYAIHIRVKFRDNEDLQLLTGTRQSGGERAVCTILYIVALQVHPVHFLSLPGRCGYPSRPLPLDVDPTIDL